MAENVIAIRLVDDNNVSSSAPPAGISGSSPGPSGFGGPHTNVLPTPSGQHNFMAIANGYLGQILTEVRVISGGVGKDKTPKKEDEEEKGRGFINRIGGLAEAGLRGMAAIMNVQAMWTQKELEAATARIRNQEQEARIAEREKIGLTAVEASQVAAAVGRHLPDVMVLGNLVQLGKIASGVATAAGLLAQADMQRDIKRMQEVLGIGRAFRARGQEMSAYDQGIARTFAMGDVNRQRRDMGEAQILSGQFSAVEAQQQQLDRLNQQLGILAKMEEADKQKKRVDEEIKDRLGDLNDKLATMPADIAKKIRELGNEVQDPFDALEAAAGFRAGPRDLQGALTERGLAARQMAAMLNIPLIQGVE